jgi:Subtilase family
MRRPLRKFAGPVLAAVALAALPASAAAETVAPLPESNYTVRGACGVPSPHRAACMALQLVPLTAAARSRVHPIGASRVSSAASHALAPKEKGFGLRPQDLRSAYELTEPAAAGEQTIALVDAYNDPRAEADLGVFSKEFGLPECTKTSGCFRQVSQTGSSLEASLPFPKSTAELKAAEAGTAEQREEAREAVGWSAEISLDIETAHAICQKCRLILVEANSPESSDMFAAEEAAESLGATEISNSWGLPDGAISPAIDNGPAFKHPGVVITASSGDFGYRNWMWVAEAEEEISRYEEELRAEGKTVTAEERAQFARELAEISHADYPASSPHVVAVGGTHLTLSVGSSAWAGESVWNGEGASGGGCSAQLTSPPWQQQVADWSSVGCGTKRAVADVAADADPYTGVAVTDSNDPQETECPGEYEGHHWCTYGGTSLASPIIAAVFALAGGSHGVSYPARTLYEGQHDAPGALHDITEGSNGECPSFNELTGFSLCSGEEAAKASCPDKVGSCMACPLYDGPTGVGTPKGNAAFAATVPAGEAPPYDLSSCALKETPPPAPPAAPQAAPASTTTVASAPPAQPPPSTPELTSLGLTTAAVIALNRRPTIAKVAFAFNSNMATRVRVTLARRVRSHHRWHWVTVGHPITVSAAAGHNVKRLAGTKRLVAGTYRLTLTPSSGKPRSVVFHIG